MEWLFCFLMFLTAVPYVIFPLTVIICARLTGKIWEQGEIRPRVSIIISVYNEEGVIGDKIRNALSLSYPEDLFEIVVVSDGSTDRTNQIVSSFTDPRVVFRPFSERKGKTSCLNKAVPIATGKILLFTDANSMFPPELLLHISRNFADPKIGLVTGWTKYRKAEGEEESVGLYARLEMATKQAESMISSCVGADGAIFAIRKELYLPLKDYDINDFVIPLNIIGQGKRVVLDTDVYCFEEPGEDESKEFRRQVRITNRTLGAIWRNIQYLNPHKYRSFALFLLCHKVIRFLLPFFFMGLLVMGLFLAGMSSAYLLFASAQIIFLGVGLAANYKFLNGRFPQLCSFFLMTIAAQSVGWMRWITGKSDTMWKPQR